MDTTSKPRYLVYGFKINNAYIIGAGIYMKTLIGRKIGMTQLLDEAGIAVPVTLLQAGPCTVTQVKSVDSDGYNAVQLGFESADKPSKPVAGHAKKAKAATTPKVIREFRVESDDVSATELGSVFDVTVFEAGDMVQVTGISKGKGFAGTVKRHNFNTSARTHGGNGVVRRGGSIGSMYPQKVFRGKKMAGHMGSEQVSTKNLPVAIVDLENNVIGIRGAVPGPRHAIVTIKGVK